MATIVQQQQLLSNLLTTNGRVRICKCTHSKCWHSSSLGDHRQEGGCSQSVPEAFHGHYTAAISVTMPLIVPNLPTVSSCNCEDSSIQCDSVSLQQQ